ncbi:MAG: hypothetical protein MUC64_03700 [Rubritepida sp.]|nr:hypothetical protein [Rubritepida sp.]
MLLAWLAVLAITALVGVAYAPGVMRPDSFAQYEEALSGRYTDWHPPVLAWLWGVIDPWRLGPLPLFALHLVLFAAGTGLLAEGLLRGGRPLAAALVLAAALLPIPLGYVGVLMKDTTLALALLLAFGLVGRFMLAGQRVPWPAALAAAALAMFAALLRFNAPFAVVPAALCLWPWLRGRSWRVQGMVGGAALVAGVALAPLASQALFRPERTQVSLSPIIYDLGGITAKSGRNQFPELGVPDFVAVNAQQCYTPFWWDNYAFGECHFVFERMRALAQEGRIGGVRLWLNALAAEPVAYLQHRVSHLNMNLRFLLPVAMEDVTFIANRPTDRGFQFTPNALTLAIRNAGLLQASTPLGWPAFWVAAAAGWLLLAPGLAPGPARLMLVALTLSALGYASSYIVFSVASDLRYHLWTMMATALASAIGVGALWRARVWPWRRALLAFVPAFLVAALGTAWRVWNLPAL